MPCVTFFTSLDPELVDLFLAHRPEGFTVTVERPDAELDRKIDLARASDYLILFPARVEDEVLTSADRLRLVQLGSAGFEHINLDLCRSRGVPVANNGGTNSIDVAEHTLALMLGAFRQLVALDRDVRTDRWWAMETGKTTHTLHGKTVGIVGLGHIGRRVARLLSPFGTTLLYADAVPAAPETEQELAIERVSLDDLLERSDVVTLHVPYDASTHHLIGKDKLTRFRPGALLVNTCRGKVIDERALAVGLAAGRPGFAALDVLEEEPPDPENPILALSNVLLTPHSAGITRDTWDRRGAFIFENLQRVENGQSALALVS